MNQPKKIILVALFAAAALLLASKAAAQSTPLTTNDARRSLGPSQMRVLEAYGRLPLSFEANQGQTKSQVKFLSHAGRTSLFLTSTEAVLTAGSGKGVSMELVGANRHPEVVGLDRLAGNTNYFLGNDPAKWHTDVPTYAKVQYTGVYPGVDLVYYGNQQRLEYDFIVAPGADPASIRMKISGSARELAIDGSGNVVIDGDYGGIQLLRPSIYQELNGKRVNVEGRYAVKGRELRFQVAKYDPHRTLIIDPVIAYATYLGGNGTDGGVGIAVDSAGGVYVVGSTTFSNFPVVSPFQSSSGGGRDLFVAKLNSTGTALIYSTYLGGSGEDDGFAIAVDSSGSAYVTGQTVSGDFPITPGAFQPLIKAAPDAFVTKLAPNGSSLVYSTFLGGSANDVAFAIAVDSAGNAYVAGETDSGDFPHIGSVPNVSNPISCDPTYNPFATPTNPGKTGTFDGFIAKVNPSGSSLDYSLFLGGTGTDRANGVAVDSSGNAYVAGNTNSTDFLVNSCPAPPPASGSLQPNNAGLNDAFVVKVNPHGTAFLAATYLGGAGQDAALGIALDGSGNVYLSGESNSNGAAILNAFGAKLDSSLSALGYLTYLGGTGFDAAGGVAVDSAGNAYLAGFTSSTNFAPLVSPIQPAFGGGTDDAFVAELGPNGAVTFSTYLGGSGGDSTVITGGPSVSVDPSGNIYVVGTTSSTDFPGVNAGSLQPTNAGTSNAFVVKLSAPNTPASNPPGSPVTVSLSNNTISVTFLGGVGKPGTTTATNLGASCPAPPTNFQFGTPPVCYDISTTASYSGPVQVCISDPSITSTSQLVHYVNGLPTVITTSINLGPPPTICGTDTSLSPFAIAQPTSQANTTTLLTASPNPSTYGQTVTFTATVSSNSGTPGGLVTFYDGSNSLGFATLSSGVTWFATSLLTAGTHSITASYSATGNFPASTSSAVTQTVNPAPLVVTVDSKSRQYGQANPPLTGTISAVQNTDITATYSTAATPASPVGAYPITALLNDPNGRLPNYTVTVNNGTLTITTAPLTITANKLTKTYGQTVGFAGTEFTSSGLLNADKVTSVTLASAGAAASAAVAGSPYPITPSAALGTGLGNYNIAYVNGTLTVTPAVLTITAGNATKVLDAPNPSPLPWTPTGFVNGDNTAVLTTNPTCTATATTTSPVGSYPITCSGAAAANYTFTYVAGTLKIFYSATIGHVIQPPINADGTSVFKQGRTVPVKFNVYDANGVPIGTPGVVSSFFLTGILSGTTSSTVEEVVDTNNPDTAFRWDGQEWIFNITTGNLTAGSTYIYTITLNDGSTITFQYGLR